MQNVNYAQGLVDAEVLMNLQINLQYQFGGSMVVVDKLERIRDYLRLEAGAEMEIHFQDSENTPMALELGT